MAGLTGSDVTIITQYYWPEHVGIAPYTTRLAEHLADRGARVHVVTAMPHYPSWRIEDSRYRRTRVLETRCGVDVNRLWHYIPSRQSAVRRAGYEATFVAHAALRRAPQADAVLGVIPSLSAGAIARIYARRRNCAYGIVVQDLPAQGARQSGITARDVVGSITQTLERWVLARAARVAVVTDRFQPHIEKAGVPAERISVLRNWVEVDTAAQFRSAPSNADGLRRSLGWGADEHVVLHAGNMGLKQGLEVVVAAARRAAERRLPIRFVLMGDGSQRSSVERQSEGVDNVQFLPNMPRDRCFEIMTVADVLLVNERATILDMALPSKLTSYFVAGRPVVAAVTDDGTTAEELRRSGGGVVVPPENPDALVDGVMRVVTDPDLAERLATSGATYAVTELSAERVLAKAEAFVRDVLAATR